MSQRLLSHKLAWQVVREVLVTSKDLERTTLRHSHGGGDPIVADHWFMQIDNVLEAMEITSDTARIRLAAFQLEGEARVCWRWARTSRDLEVMTWAEFHELFMGQVLSRDCEVCKAQEFLEL